MLCFIGCAETATIEFIPVKDPSSDKIIAKLETRIYKPSGDGPFPLAILSHGSSGGKPEVSISWKKEAEYFNQMGYVVLAPMRKGRGKSTGDSLESEDKNCDLRSWNPGIEDAMRDIDATIEWAQKLSFVDSKKITLIGVSRGGFLSVSYAARGKYNLNVNQVINFVGGWVAQAEDECPDDFNLKSFQSLGGLTNIPMLWLYGANDLFYGDKSVKDYAATFKAAGGNIEFHLIGGVPNNGHWLPDHPNLWAPYTNSFLQRTGIQ
jgi:dienelactone hydrolase